MSETFPKMNPEVKALWIEALLSGDYKQGKSWLKQVHDDGPAEYCCLGVLCDLAEKAGIVTSTEESTTQGGRVVRYSSSGNEEYSEVTVLPKTVADWADFKWQKSISGSIVGPNQYGDFEGGCSLVSLNDTGASFEHIAGVIEEMF